MQIPKGIVITIGDELLIGQVLDTNSYWITQELNKIGIDIIETICIGDNEQSIKETLKYSTTKADIIITTGGLGPTKDDKTKLALAQYYSTKLVWSQDTFDRLVQLSKKVNFELNQSHHDQCYMPESAELLRNEMGTAPGLKISRDNHTLFCMPGVPYEMKYIMTSSIIPFLRQVYASQYIMHKTILTFGLSETIIEESIAAIVNKFPQNYSISYLPNLGFVRVRITGKGTDKNLIDQTIDKFCSRVSDVLGDIVYGYDEETFINSIAKILLRNELSLGTIESCTGGKIASIIVDEPGSSRFFQGSIVAYSNIVKENILLVNPAIFNTYGAVSQESVISMLKGGLSTLDIDIGIAISGIAGPSGGTQSKPVGTVWIAYGNKDIIKTAKLNLSKNRTKNIEYSSTYALNKLRLFLLEHYS